MDYFTKGGRKIGVVHGSKLVKFYCILPLPRIDASGISFEDNVRFGSVQARCVERRESLGRSIREVSRELQLPQYRLKDIESCRVKQIEPSALARYISYLGIDSWFRQWCKANLVLSSRLGVGAPRSETSKKTKKK